MGCWLRYLEQLRLAEVGCLRQRHALGQRTAHGPHRHVHHQLHARAAAHRAEEELGLHAPRSSFYAATVQNKGDTAEL